MLLMTLSKYCKIKIKYILWNSLKLWGEKRLHVCRAARTYPWQQSHDFWYCPKTMLLDTQEKYDRRAYGLGPEAL